MLRKYCNKKYLENNNILSIKFYFKDEVKLENEKLLYVEDC